MFCILALGRFFLSSVIEFRCLSALMLEGCRLCDFVIFLSCIIFLGLCYIYFFGVDERVLFLYID